MARHYTVEALRKFPSQICSEEEGWVILLNYRGKNVVECCFDSYDARTQVSRYTKDKAFKNIKSMSYRDYLKDKELCQDSQQIL